MVKVFMKEGHLWQDITHAVVAEKGIPIRMGFSSLQDSQDVGSITLTLHMDSLEGASLIGMERRAVRVTKNDVPIFEGVTVDDSKVDLKHRSDLVYAQVKCKPYSALFDEVKTASELVWTDIPILTSSPDCLIRRLFGLLTDMMVVSETEITKELTFVKLEKGEGVEEYLTEVLYQQGLAYYVDVDVIYIVEPYKDRSLSHSLEIGEILASPKITQSPYIVDERCVVRLPKTLVYNSEVVYELNKSRYPDTGEPTEYAVIESGEHYPVDDEGPSLLEAVYATDRETEDIELVHAEGLDIDVHTRRQVGEGTEKVYISLSVDSLDSESATLQLYNDKGYEVSLRNIRILASTAYYYDWTTVYEDIEILGEDDEVDGIYLADSSQARAFIKRYRAEKNAERTSVEFTTHLKMQPNSLIEIAGLPYQLLVRYRTEDEGYFTYRCVAYQVNEVETKGRIRVVPREGVRDGTSPIAVVLYALGDMDGPFAEVDEAPVVVADENYLLSDEQYIVGTGSPWSQVPPVPGEGEVVWTITGYYVPPQIFPNKWTAPIRVTGEPAKLIRLFANPSAIQKSARGLYEQTEVEIEASVQGLSGELSWSVSDGDWEYAKDGVEDIPNKIILDATSVEGLSTVVSASIGDFTSSLAISVIIAGGEVPHNFGGVTVVPDHNTLDVGALMKGDYFLWAGDPKPKDDSAVPPYDAMVKGEVYEYNGTRWVKSDNGDLIMTLFDSFADLANDVDSAVMGNVVIKKLVAIDAFIKNLVAENLQAGSGTGLAGSGFRFRAKSDKDGDGTSNPVFDLMFHDQVLFKVDVATGKIYFGAHFWYDPATETIRSKNDKMIIGADGKLIAVDGDFTGTANIKEGLFEANIDAPSFSSLPGSGGTSGSFSGTTAKQQVEGAYNTIKDFLVPNKLYPCVVSGDSSVKYISHDGRSIELGSSFHVTLHVSGGTNKTMSGAIVPFSGAQYTSPYAGQSKTFTFYYGMGDVFKFKNLPTDDVGLSSGQVWRDGTTLKIVP